MRRLSRGFTLVELLVTITVISILATIVYANVGKANPKARDVERQADLRNLQSAIEQFKQKNGKYPAMGCGPGTNGLSDEGDCPNGSYITGLAPEFITVLPKDSRRESAAGYAYVTNSMGSSYKIMAVGTVESETVTNTHPMKSCDTTDICNGTCGIGTLQGTSYGLWGGYAEGIVDSSPAQVKIETAKVICE